MGWNRSGENRLPFPDVEGLDSVELWGVIEFLKYDRRKEEWYLRQRLACPGHRHQVKRERVSGSLVEHEDGSSVKTDVYDCSLMHCGLEGSWRERITVKTAADGTESVDAEVLAKPTEIVFREHEYRGDPAVVKNGVWPNPRLRIVAVRVIGRSVEDRKKWFKLAEIPIDGAREEADAALAGLNAEIAERGAPTAVEVNRG